MVYLIKKELMDFTQIIFNIAQSVPGFLLAIVCHEAAHAWMANRFGDNTAKAAGRLTLNPAAHYDPWGTVLLPLIAAVSGFAVIGWAKPVPVNPRNFSKIRKGIFWVSFAGPLANFIVGILCALVFAIILAKIPSDFSYYAIMLRMLNYAVFINFILGFFNLLPIPPLDGSKMVASLLNYEAARKYEELARYSNFIFLGLIMLSFAGFNVFGKLLAPAYMASTSIVHFFIGLAR
jgi:Zn-dependent protease